MHDERRPIPSNPELFAALKALIELQFERPEWIEENDLARATSLLTLERVGGPQMPAKHDRAERFQNVRGLLREVAPRLRDLSQAELEKANLVYPATEPKGRERYAREAKRLPVAARALFQLGIPEPDREIEIGTIRSATNAIWGKPEHPKSRWFEKKRQEFVLERLANWIIKAEEGHREANPPASTDDDADSLPPFAEATSPPASAVLDEHPSGLADEVAQDSDDDDSVILDAEAATPLEPRRPRIRRLVIPVFTIVLAAVLAIAAVVLDGAEAPENAAGEVGRVLDVPAPEDLAVAGGFVWLVDANHQTAIRVSERTGERETIFVDEPPFYSDPLPGTRTGIRVGGYQVAAGKDRAWIVSNGGVVLTIRTTGRKVEVLHPRVKVINGEPVLYRGSLWIGGFSEHLYRLHATDGAVQGRFALRGHPFSVDALAAGVGSVWAYTKSRSDEPRLYKLTPVPGQPGVEETYLRLDHPILDLAAGLGGVWTVGSDGVVAQHDPALGRSVRAIRVPGGAQEIALGREAVWVTTGDNAVVRIDPITLAVVGKPIPLPGTPTGIAADERAWVATDKKLVEIAS